ncbi:MAG: hypothetical protein ABIH68_01080 [bacterium]
MIKRMLLKLGKIGKLITSIPIIFSSKSLRSHFGTLKRGEHSKYLPYVFTGQGVAMFCGRKK